MDSRMMNSSLSYQGTHLHQYTLFDLLRSLKISQQSQGRLGDPTIMLNGVKTTDASPSHITHSSTQPGKPSVTRDLFIFSL